MILVTISADIINSQHSSFILLQLYPVTSSYGGRVYFSLERAAAPYFGIKVCHIFRKIVQDRDDNYIV